MSEITNLQRNLLWCGVERKKKINWILWSNIWRSWKEGRLGVKDYGRLNIAFLRKWLWRIIIEQNTIWYDLLSFSYGDLNWQFHQILKKSPYGGKI